MTPDARQPIGKETAVQLGLVILVLGAVAGGSWRLAVVVTEQEADRRRIEALERLRDADGSTLREVRDVVLELKAEVRALRREMDAAKGPLVLPARGER